MHTSSVLAHRPGWGGLSRSETLLYYISNLLYFWVLCTPVVSWIFGSYLYFCVNWLCVHFDEAFSALRIPHYKSFLRLHIDEKGTLEVFAVGLRKIPRRWEANTTKGSSHNPNPSRWVPAPGQPGAPGGEDCGAEVVDYLRVEKSPTLTPTIA
eukprot:5874430-Pyramimonas_sp.AAC.2